MGTEERHGSLKQLSPAPLNVDGRSGSFCERKVEPLEKLVVLELADGIAGPTCGLMLADLGARVIKIEGPDGDRTRGWGPPYVGKESAIFIGLNHNKESVVLDPEEKETLSRLIERADVLIEHPRLEVPSAAARLGTDPVSINPGLIHLHISPNGTEGEFSGSAGSEMTAEALSGYWRLLGRPGEAPLRHGAEIAEIATSLFAGQAILAALIGRQRGKGGQRIDVSLLQSLMSTSTILHAASHNPDAWKGFHLLNLMWAPDTGFRTADGQITLDFRRGRALWEEFCRTFGLENLIDDPRFSNYRSTIYTGDRVEETRADYEAALTKFPSDVVLEAAARIGGTAVRYNDMSAAVSHPQVESTGIIGSAPLPGGGAIRRVSKMFSLELSGARAEATPAPRLGEHTDTVRQELDAQPTASEISVPARPVQQAETTSAGPTGPLAGLRVLDMGTAGVGPWGAMLLGQMGAEVIKLENPSGDSIHHVPPTQNGFSSTYAALNLNKRGIILDLKNEVERAAAIEIASEVDVIIENFRVGVVDRLGLGYEALKHRNPGLVYLSVRGYGATGPMRDMGCTDPHCQAFCGYGSLNGVPGGSGQLMRYYAHHDLNTSMVLTFGILAALLEREKSGRGQRVETSMLQAGIALQRVRLSEYFATGVQPPRLGSAISYCVPDQAFLCGDQVHLAVSAGSEAEWQRLCTAIGMPELIEDERFRRNEDRVRNRVQLLPMLEERFLKFASGYWHLALTRAQVPVAFYWDHGDHMQSRHIAANEMLATINREPWGEVLVGGMPWRFHVTKGGILPPCFPGEETNTVLREFGVNSNVTRDKWRPVSRD
jgi:crotonobetainyl-CoA:carnitine CoA-transferase CaiB-like acyl-CoA transferase